MQDAEQLCQKCPYTVHSTIRNITCHLFIKNLLNGVLWKFYLYGQMCSSNKSEHTCSTGSVRLLMKRCPLPFLTGCYITDAFIHMHHFSVATAHSMVAETTAFRLYLHHMIWRETPNHHRKKKAQFPLQCSGWDVWGNTVSFNIQLNLMIIQMITGINLGNSQETDFLKISGRTEAKMSDISHNSS